MSWFLGSGRALVFLILAWWLLSPAAKPQGLSPAAKKLKIYLSVDMEGVAGVVTELVCGHHACNAFHVHRKVNFEFLCCRGETLRLRRRTQKPPCQNQKYERTSAAKEPAHIRTSQTHGLNAGEGESIKFAPRKLRETPGQLRLRRESYSRECRPYLPRDEHTRPPASSPREYPAAALAQTRCDRAF